MDTSRHALTVAEAAVVFRISEKSMRKAIAAGEIHAVRIGSRIIVPSAPLLALLGIESANAAVPAAATQEEERRGVVDSA